MYKYKVIATIIEIRGEGKCSYGHKVGDSFEFGQFTPETVSACLRFFCVPVAAPFYGGYFPWLRIVKFPPTCPDPDRP